MKVKELMSTGVVTATPAMSLKEAAGLLVGHRISGLPVCDENRRVLGVLSEADILVKEGGPTERDGLLGWMLGSGEPPQAAKLRARTVGEAMTSPGLTIGPHRSAAAAARMMIGHDVNRLPVVALDGTLVGIVTRADLVRAFVRSDGEIEADIRRETLHGALWLEPNEVRVAVSRGEVELTGEVETTADAELVESLVARTPGVIAVRSTVRARTEGAVRA